MIQLQGDQRKDVQEFLVDKKEGLELDPKTIKVRTPLALCLWPHADADVGPGPRLLGRKAEPSRCRACIDGR